MARAHADTSPMELALRWTPSWKTAAIAAILAHRPQVFVDVGANVGQTLLDYLRAPARTSYLGFEPNPSCAQFLSDLIAQLPREACRIVMAGLSDTSRPAELFLFEAEADPGASFNRGLRPASAARPRPACLYRFDDLAQFAQIDVALVKIDVEGGELEALRGMQDMIARCEPWIICEVLHRDQAADRAAFVTRMGELTRLIEGLDYKIARLVPGGPDGDALPAMEELAEFPNLGWSDTSASACDYLLYPATAQAAVRTCFAEHTSSTVGQG